MYMQRVRSEGIDSVGYNAQTRTLYVRFIRDPKICHYPDVPMHVYEGMMGVPYKGEYFEAHIRDNFPEQA